MSSAGILATSSFPLPAGAVVHQLHPALDNVGAGLGEAGVHMPQQLGRTSSSASNTAVTVPVQADRALSRALGLFLGWL